MSPPPSPDLCAALTSAVPALLRALAAGLPRFHVGVYAQNSYLTSDVAPLFPPAASSGAAAATGVPTWCVDDDDALGANTTYLFPSATAVTIAEAVSTNASDVAGRVVRFENLPLVSLLLQATDVGVTSAAAAPSPVVWAGASSAPGPGGGGAATTYGPWSGAADGCGTISASDVQAAIWCVFFFVIHTKKKLFSSKLDV